MELLLNQLGVSKEGLTKLVMNPYNPVTLTFTSPSDQLITIPIWILLQNDKFYMFASRNSTKVKSIEQGNTNVSLTIVNRKLYPHPSKNELSYLSVTGSASIKTAADIPNIAEIQIRLLSKYNIPEKHDWIDQLIDKLEKDPKNAWLIEIVPQHLYTYRG
ncbi:MAG: hypothetical protein ACXAC2_00950 [Candidatus Kariarchaeaceae archaeon]|jgi:nitroimidazol reductase NimA-like FMN-containing flavoprotein (pyridoxamine 5'-phosphate oxidase superfamily)